MRTALVVWLRRHAAARLPERVETWRAKAGVAMPRVVVADQRKRWGSCDRSGTIRLNCRIIQAPMRLIDYVVVHELVHLRHRGHGRDYWRAAGLMSLGHAMFFAAGMYGAGLSIYYLGFGAWARRPWSI